MKKKKKKETPAISTASLPDIVFMLLFFFMVSTVMRESESLVEYTVPSASQLVKLKKKSLVTNLYIGKPKETGRYGSQPRIQANDALITPDGIIQWVENERSEMPEKDRDKMVVSMKIDKETKMGIVNDVKLNLRKASARKINYSSVQSSIE